MYRPANNSCCTDLITEAELRELKAAISVLNPDAKILESRQSAVPLKEILHTGRFSMDKAATHSGWVRLYLRSQCIRTAREYAYLSTADR